MIQDIIALTIVFSAFGYTIFSAIKTVTSQKKTGCGSGCDCTAKKDIRRILLNNVKPLPKNKMTLNLKFKI